MLCAYTGDMRSTHPTLTVFVVAALVALAAQAGATATATQEQGSQTESIHSDLVSGNAMVDVTVLDRSGAPLEGVSVKLTGVVDRVATSNDVGMVAFEGLPQGRYDVVASLKGLVPSLPRVVDVPAFGIRALAVTLKPHGRQVGMTACGGFDARSVGTLSVGAHLVLHVKVVDQDAIATKQGQDDASWTYISTHNRVQVLHSFKNNPRAPSAGSVVTIQQGGGRIDRGDHIDSQTFNSLAPLNIGDDYVLFVHVDNRGTFTIVGAEEGAFRVRNGRVESLGGAGAASTWNRQPAGKFFAALSAQSLGPQQLPRGAQRQ